MRPILLLLLSLVTLVFQGLMLALSALGIVLGGLCAIPVVLYVIFIKPNNKG